jgi:hypothetical protein
MIININLSNEIVIELAMPRDIEIHIQEFLSKQEIVGGFKCIKNIDNGKTYLFWIDNNKSIDNLLTEINKLVEFSIEKELKNKILKEKMVELENMVNSYNSKELNDLSIVLNR